jgi:hypothetical protein
MYPVRYFGTTGSKRFLQRDITFQTHSKLAQEGSMKKSLSPETLREVGTRLEQAHKLFEKRYPGDSDNRQPVHVVYGGAHLFRSGTSRKLGALALQSLDEYAPDFVIFAKVFGLPGSDRLPNSSEAAVAVAKSIEKDPDTARRENRPAWFAHTLYRRVREKLQREPVEDFRIDFEDGYGTRPDEEEDAHAVAAANELAQAMNSGEVPPFIGIRVKPLTEELRDRSIRTLDIFITELAHKTRGRLPKDFRVTLPKVSLPDEVAAFGRSVFASGTRARSGTRRAPHRINDRDHASDLQRARRSESASHCERRARALPERPFRALRLHGVPQYCRVLESAFALRL